MMKRTWMPLLAVMVLGACDPTVPDSAAGVGFGNYNDYQAMEANRLERERLARERQITGATRVTPPTDTGAPTPLQVQNTPVITAQAAPEASPAITAATAALANLPSPDLSNDPQVARTDGLSDEQDFNAVSGRETIQSNADRLSQQRSQYAAVQPTILPARTDAAGGVNIVDYALKSTNTPGVSVYKRSFGSDRRAARSCASYTSPDKAQQAFLELGGPEKDRKSLDPDGDGFACGWDPRPFRKAVQG